MNESARPNANFLLKWSFPLLLLIIIGFAAQPLTGGDDFWAHASIGRWIVEHHRIPDHTLFLWSANVPWIAHAWGTGVLFYEIMHIGGEKGGPLLAILLNVVLCSLPFVLIWRLWRRTGPFTSIVPPLFVMAIWLGAARFHPRPELFTALFLTLLLLFLVEWPQQTKLPIGQVVGILLMFMVWPNLHGAVAVGLVVLYLTAFCDLAQKRGDFRLLGLAVVCTLLVFVCNPRGFEYYKVLVPIASQTFKKIDEWKPVWAAPALAPELVIGELILWGAGLLLWAKNPNRRWAQLGWLLLMAAAFLQARRQLWLMAITSLIVFVANAQNLQSDELFRGWRRATGGDVSEGIPDPMRLTVRVGVLIMLICSLVAIPKDFLLMGATDKRLPVKMADFLLNKAPQGRIWNDYEYSAYLEWGLHDKRKLYIDLNNAYPDTLMDEYFKATDASTNPVKEAKYDVTRAAILDKLDIEVVTIRPHKKTKPATKPGEVAQLGEGLSMVAEYLNNSPHWKRIYRDVDGAVWARVHSKTPTTGN